MQKRTLTPEEITSKSLVKGGLAAAAPGLAMLVIAFAADPTFLLQNAKLGFFGLLAVAVELFALGYLLRKARWWAGIPTLVACLAAIVFFITKFLRPLLAYWRYNPINSLGDALEPLMLLSPQLVLVLISLTLGLVVLRTMRIARHNPPLPVTRLAWGVMALWLVILAGDAWYQNQGWQSMGGPKDLVLRLCLGSESDQRTAQNRLRELGVEAAPTLVQGLSLGGRAVAPVIDCTREKSGLLLQEMGRQALPALRDAAAKGDEKAAALLERMQKPGS
ncbi:MAG: hypothetical protein K9K65_04560 [Desulfarculaceae bacterium]|nr:hypothetical protein [Desulfarculaceae bacterium]MCF8046255.1 hypothetical protein [Desulfarculaceae bacterium]MCF8063656.1 hypothetical protein [Desulfarculaceae bacterium]MCF8097094.1 hypothetical protein [Desulfarculaceae bacterium]MCF8120962.1 hypothetical protein [Desulfarculaceae bacterium]